jgi:hypothetical protein
MDSNMLAVALSATGYLDLHQARIIAQIILADCRTVWRRREVREGLNRRDEEMRESCGNMKRNRVYMLGETALLQDLIFQRTFRLSRGAFEKLLGISFYLRRQEEFAVRSSGSAISPRTRLMAMLRWLAEAVT